MSLHHPHSSSLGSSLSTPVHFECYRMCTVLGHLKRYKISCFCTYGDSLLVASSDGALRLFDTDEEKAVWRERVLDEQFGGKKGVEMMAVVDVTVHSSSGSSGGEDALLVSIVSGVCRVHTLPSLRSLSLLAESKGCYTFAVNATHYSLDPAAPQPTIASFLASPTKQPTDAPLLLCLANKRKQLLFYQWKDAGSSPSALNGDFQLVHTVPVDHTVHSMTFSLLSLVAGVGREYVLVKLEGGRAGGSGVRLFDCGKKSTSPVSCLVVSRNRDDDSSTTAGSSTGRRKANAANRPVEEERELVLVQDARGICINEEGQPSRKDAVNFSDLPLQLASAPPYLFALLPSGIEVRQARSSLLAQSIATKEGQAKWMEARRGCVFVGGSGWARCVYPIPLREVVDECVRSGQYREAMGMVQLSDEMQWRRGREERDERLNELHTLYAYELFNKGDYQQAMMYFQQSNCDPTTVISLFPDVLPASSAELRHMMDGVKHPVRVTSAQGEQTLLAALEAVISYLAQVQVKIQRQQAAASSNTAVSSNNNSSSIPSLLARLIDTVLLKAYLLRDIPLLPFLQQPNACDVEECSAILRAYEKYPELVCLYQQHGYHKEALELLASIGQASLNSTAPLKPAQQAVAGLTPSIDYMQQLVRATTPQTVDNTLALITQYSRWLFQADPLTALTIFTAEHDESGSSSVPPQAVLDYLRQVGGRDVCIVYVESLIEKTSEQDNTFHNELVLMYLDAVLKLMKQEERAKSQESSPALSGTHTPSGEEKEGNGKAALLPTKKKSASSTAASRRTPASLAASSSTSSLSPADAASLLSLRRRLLSFLRRSTAYTPERLLSKFPRHHLLEERCVLLSRVGQHEEALRLLAHQLGDTEAAERYCVEVDSRRQRAATDGSSTEDGSSTANNELFLLLLQVYLKRDSAASTTDMSYGAAAGEEKRAATSAQPSPRLLAAAVSLLTKHFQHINPVAALSLLPSSTPVAALHAYLCRLLRSLQHSRRSAAITRALYRVEHINARLAVLEAGRECVVVDDTRQVGCRRCHKRIGTASFVRLPDGGLLHYMCHKQEASGGGMGT